MQSKLLLAVLFAVIVGLAGTAAARTWKDRTGRTLEADFVRLNGDKVVLSVNGRDVEVELSKLSDEDQEVARKLAAGDAPDEPADKPDTTRQDDEKEPAPAPTRKLPDMTKPRKWTDRDGKSVNAIFSILIRDKVMLRSGTQSVQVPYAEFCDDDQEIIRLHMESERRGLSVPPGPNDIADEQARYWKDRDDNQVRAILRRVEEEGQVVLQLDTATAPFSFTEFDAESQEYVRDKLAALGKEALLPKDESIREWTDWKGENFTAKLDPTSSFKVLGTTVYFKSAGEKFTKNFNSLSESDRTYLMQLMETEGRPISQKPFAEPPTKARTFTQKRNNSPLDAKFVEMAGTYVVLRTEDNPERRMHLSDFVETDREYIRKELTDRGEEHLVPILDDECRPWTFGPAGQGNTVTAKLLGATAGVVKLALADRTSVSPPKRETMEIAFACLSAADKTFVKNELGGQARALESASASKLTGKESRDWQYDGDQRLTGQQLLYVKDTSVGIGEGSSYRWVNFKSLSAADQDYVARAVAALGMQKFEPPAPTPSRPSYSGPPSSSNPYESGPTANYNPSPAPSGPSYNPPSSSGSYGEYGSSMYVQVCSNCNKQVSSSARNGQKCPHCGVIWGSRGGFSYQNGLLVGIITVVLLVIGAVSKVVYGKFQGDAS